jgi:hypothetical protein
VFNKLNENVWGVDSYLGTRCRWVMSFMSLLLYLWDKRQQNSLDRRLSDQQRRWRTVELYRHSSIRLHGIVLS